MALESAQGNHDPEMTVFGGSYDELHEFLEAHPEEIELQGIFVDEAEMAALGRTVITESRIVSMSRTTRDGTSITANEGMQFQRLSAYVPVVPEPEPESVPINP